MIRDALTSFLNTPFGTALIAAILAVFVALLVAELIAHWKLKGRIWSYVTQVVLFTVFGYLLLTLPYFNFSWLGF